MLNHKIIETSRSEWSSPVLLVPKPNGSQILCIDYRKVNSVTKTDSYPIPRIDYCIDKIGQAKYVTNLDLVKVFGQIPLSERSKEISAFVTPNRLYSCTVMPLGVKNAPSTFQRLMNHIVHGLQGGMIDIDDAVIYSDTWEKHLVNICTFLERLPAAIMTVNLTKSDFAHAYVIYLGHIVGQGQVRPRDAKIKCILECPVPTTRK